MNEYPTGNLAVLQMIQNHTFDDTMADVLLKESNLNSPIINLYGYSSTYLYEAVSENNLPAVSFLLKHGADPNLNNPELICDCALWELQYLNYDQDWKTRYETSKLFFKYGANPNITLDMVSLYDYIVFKVYNDLPSDIDDRENLLHLYKLLIVFGGGADDEEHGKPHLTNVDPNKVDEYSIEFMMHKDGYHI